MIKKFIYQLFLPNETSENIVEVFNCYDSRYGNIFFKGELIAHFYKEHYDEIVNKYSVVREMQKSGLDVDSAKVLVYDMEAMRDYQSYMSVIDFECAIEYEYEDLFKAFQTDLNNIQTVVADLESKERWFKFIRTQNLG